MSVPSARWVSQFSTDQTSDENLVAVGRSNPDGGRLASVAVGSAREPRDALCTGVPLADPLRTNPNGGVLCHLPRHSVDRHCDIRLLAVRNIRNRDVREPLAGNARAVLGSDPGRTYRRRRTMCSCIQSEQGKFTRGVEGRDAELTSFPRAKIVYEGFYRRLYVAAMSLLILLEGMAWIISCLWAHLHLIHREGTLTVDDAQLLVRNDVQSRQDF